MTFATLASGSSEHPRRRSGFGSYFLEISVVSYLVIMDVLDTTISYPNKSLPFRLHFFISSFPQKVFLLNRPFS